MLVQAQKVQADACTALLATDNAFVTTHSPGLTVTGAPPDFYTIRIAGPQNVRGVCTAHVTPCLEIVHAQRAELEHCASEF